MTELPPIPLTYLPGVCKVDSALLSSIQAATLRGHDAIGRFTDMDRMRFVAGEPEKIGGNEKAIDEAMIGVPRGLKDWRDNSQVVYLGAGTSKRLYYFSNAQLVNITPLRPIVTGTLTNPISVILNDTEVLVTDSAHGLQTGDYVQLTASSAVGGVLIAGTYHITVVDNNNYTIQSSTPGTSTSGPGGGSVSYTYYRATLTNPFATVNGSTTITVTHASHGAIPGDTVIFSGASAVGGLTIDGEYTIVTTSANTYTITAASAATSTASGGGSVSVQYEISIGLDDSIIANGYGTGGFSDDGFGTTGDTSIFYGARIWYLQKYGQQLLALPSGGTIYIWDPTIGGRAFPMYGAPEMCLGFFVTPERYVFALGINGNAMTIAWPDQNDYTQWVSTATNTANEGRTLQEGSFLVNGVAVRDGISLIFSNITPYSVDYTGDNFIYQTHPIGIGAGLIGPLAMCTVSGVAYWMGDSEFWTWDGTVRPLPSDDIRDFVFKDINLTQGVKCVAGSNIAKKEVWFFYCSAASEEIDRYVIHHIDQNCWSCGTMERTSWIDRGLFRNPIATQPDGYILYQESGLDDNGAAVNSYLTYSPVDISKGARNCDVMGFMPDFKRQVGDVDLTMYEQDYPKTAQTVYGPYAIEDDASTPLIDVRLGSKFVSYMLRSNVVGGDLRVGLPTLSVQPAGARR